jgi:hypothetical protein
MLAIRTAVVSSETPAPPAPLNPTAAAGPDSDKALQRPSAATHKLFIRTLHTVLFERRDYSVSRTLQRTAYPTAPEGSENTYGQVQSREPKAQLKHLRNARRRDCKPELHSRRRSGGIASKSTRASSMNGDPEVTRGVSGPLEHEPSTALRKTGSLTLTIGIFRFFTADDLTISWRT